MSPVLKNFIVFEGLDGAGTTTQSKLLSTYLTSKGKNSIFTFEPTDSPIGSFIRKEILQKKISVNPKTLLYLYLADRNEHLYSQFGIINATKENKLVICDRYFYSTIAYQSLSLPFDEVEKHCFDFPLPEFLFFIDTPVDVCLDRIEKRNESKELFEKKELLTLIRKNYCKAFDKVPQAINFFILDGTMAKEELFEFIRKKIDIAYGIQ